MAGRHHAGWNRFGVALRCANEAMPPARARSTTRREANARRPSADSQDDETSALVEEIARGGNKKRGRGRGPKGISAEFTSLDALLNNDSAEQKHRQQQETKLQKLREEAKRARKGELDSSPLAKIVHDMEVKMSSLDADSRLFDDARPNDQEKFGFVFTPITAPLRSPAFKATTAELNGPLELVYKIMQAADDEQTSALLWSKAILARALLVDRHTARRSFFAVAVKEPVIIPTRICAWMFVTMSTHPNSHIVKGCLSNLLVMVSSASDHKTTQNLCESLPCCSFAHDLGSFRSADLQMEWRPTMYDFLNAFRRFGFQDSKRSMSTKSKITPTKKNLTLTAVPFPTLNMQSVLAFFVLSLRVRLLKLEGFDAFNFTLFFLRMQFEEHLHGEIVHLASVCIEELLEVFPTTEWRKDWAPSIVLRIAGAREGLFDSASGWLSVARRLPRTKRGTQLTTGLAIYVLQHRVDKPLDKLASSEPPLKFPIQSGIVLDIVVGIVDDLTAKYLATKHDESAKTAPLPFDMLSIKVALMDLALQAFLNVLTHTEMSILLGKLDDLTEAHKSTMCAKWHELKTVVSLMHRKYSRENLRVGREVSPKAKTVLFLDE